MGPRDRPYDTMSREGIAGEQVTELSIWLLPQVYALVHGESLPTFLPRQNVATCYWTPAMTTRYDIFEIGIFTRYGNRSAKSLAFNDIGQLLVGFVIQPWVCQLRKHTP